MSPPATCFRPIRPDDKRGLASFFARLSPESRRRRFLAPKASLTSRDLALLTEVDGRDHVALVAEDAGGEIVAVARYASWGDGSGQADVAFAVADEWHGRGLGTAIAGRLVAHARDAGVPALTASTLAENLPARGLLRRLGFTAASISGGVVEYELALGGASALPLAA